MCRLSQPEPPPRRPALLLRRGSKFRYSSGRTLEQMRQATYEPKDQSIHRWVVQMYISDVAMAPTVHTVPAMVKMLITRAEVSHNKLKYFACFIDHVIHIEECSNISTISWSDATNVFSSLEQCPDFWTIEINYSSFQ